MQNRSHSMNKMPTMYPTPSCILHRLILTVSPKLAVEYCSIFRGGISPIWAMPESSRKQACGHVCWGRSASQSTASNAAVVVIGCKKSRIFNISLWHWLTELRLNVPLNIGSFWRCSFHPISWPLLGKKSCCSDGENYNTSRTTGHFANASQKPVINSCGIGSQT